VDEWAHEIKKYVRGEGLLSNGKYFAMGRHRDHSLDSRYWDLWIVTRLWQAVFDLLVGRSEQRRLWQSSFCSGEKRVDTLLHCHTHRWSRMLRTCTDQAGFALRSHFGSLRNSRTYITVYSNGGDLRYDMRFLIAAQVGACSGRTHGIHIT